MSERAKLWLNETKRDLLGRKLTGKAFRMAVCVALAILLVFNASIGMLGAVLKAEAAAEIDLSSYSWQIFEGGDYSRTATGRLYNDQGNNNRTASVPSVLTGKFGSNGSNGYNSGGTNEEHFLYYIAVPGLAAGTYDVSATAQAIATSWGGSVYDSTTKLFAFAGSGLSADSALTESAAFGKNTADQTKNVTVTVDEGETLYLGLHMIAEYYDFTLTDINLTSSEGSGGSGSGGSDDPGTDAPPVTENATLVNAPGAPGTASQSYYGAVGSAITAASGNNLNFSFETNNDNNTDDIGWTFSDGVSIVQGNNQTISFTMTDESQQSNHTIGASQGNYILRQQPGEGIAQTTQVITGLNPDYMYRISFDAKSIGRGVSTFTASAPGVEADEDGTYHINSNLGTFGNGITSDGNNNRDNGTMGWHTGYVYAKPNANGELVLTFTSELGEESDATNLETYKTRYTLFADNVVMQSYKEPTAESIDIPVTLYDFSFRDPDTAKFFEFTWQTGNECHQVGVYNDLLEGVLDENGRPIFTDRVTKYNTNANYDAINGNYGTTTPMSADHLNETVEMFRKDGIPSSLTLYKDNSGAYVFDSLYANSANGSNVYEGAEKAGFFPLCDTDTDAEGIKHNYHFGMEMNAQFLVSTESNETFTFHGDDDFWLFIDGVLVLDIGGVHEKIEGVVDLGKSTTTSFNDRSENSNGTPYLYDVVEANLADYYGPGAPEVTEKLNEMFGEGATSTSKLAPGYHDLTIYYMERNTEASNLKIVTNLAFADLELHKSANKLDENGQIDVADKLVKVGDKIRYAVSITNPSNLPSESIEVMDAAPEGVNFIKGTMSYYAITADGAPTEAAPTLTLTEGEVKGTVTLPANTTLHIVFDAEVVSTVDSKGNHIDSITNFAYINDAETASDTLYTNPLEIEKSIVDEKSNYNVDDTITYNIVVTNIGSRTLENITVEDTLLAGGKWLDGTVGDYVIASLGAGQSKTLNFQYKVTEADLQNGKVLNTAIATTVVPGTNNPVVVEDDAEATVVANNPKLAINKTVAATNGGARSEHVSQQPGQSVFFYLEVENTGDAPLTNVEITDNHTVTYLGTEYAAGDVINTIPTLAPAQKVEIGPLVYNIPAGTDASANNKNIATASSNFEGKTIESSDTAEYTIEASTRLTAVKQVSATGADGSYTSDPITVEKGSTVYYQFVIRNEGNVPMTVELKDIMNPSEIIALDWVNSALSSFVVEPYSEKVFTDLPVTFLESVQYTDNKAINTLETRATYVDPVSGETSQYVEYPIVSSVTVNLTDPVEPDMSIVKTITAVNGKSNSASIPTVRPGDEITYTITVTNTGNCALNVSLEDVFDGSKLTLPSSDSSFTLGVGDSKNIVVRVTVDSDAANADVLTNIATATGTVPSSVPGTHAPIVRDDDASAVVKNENIVPSIDIKKSVDKPTAFPGDTVEYTLVVTNTGNVELTNTVVEDDKVFDANTVASSITGWTRVGATTVGQYSIGTLEIGGTRTLKYQYTIPSTANAGESYLNTAVVTAKKPDGGDIEDTDNETVTVGQKAALMVTKTVSDIAPDPGDTITYKVVVTNIGSSPLTGVTWQDKFAIAGVEQSSLPTGWTTELNKLPATLAPGQKWESAEMPYEIDPDAEKGTDYRNTITVDSAETEPVSDEALSTVGADSYSKVTISKVAVKESVKAGEPAEFVIVVANNSNATLTDLVVYDIADVIGTTQNIANPDFWQVGTLEPGKVWTKSVFVDTTAQMKGDIKNTAYLDKNDGEFNPNDTTTYLDNDDAVVKVDNTPALDIRKTANVSEAKIGDNVVYTIVVTNTGNCDLSNVDVLDSISGGTWAPYVLDTGVSAVMQNGHPVLTSFPKGKTATYTYTYRIPATAVIGSKIDNIATASVVVDPVTGEKLEVSDDVPVIVAETPIVPNAKFEVTKDVSQTKAKAGDTVHFWITITNTGNVPLCNISVTDTFTRQLGTATNNIPTSDWEVIWPTELAVGQVWRSPMLAYVVPATAQNNELFNNIVTVEASYLQGGTPEELDPKSDNAGFTVEKVSDVKLTKTVTPVQQYVGKDVFYTITVENTGNTILENVVVTDAMLDGSWTIASLNPGETAVVATVPYTIPEDHDITAVPNIVNTANVTATPQGEQTPVTDTDDANVKPLAKPLRSDITIIKEVVGATERNPGDVVVYTILVENSGDTDYTDLVVKDELLGKQWTIGSLKAGESYIIPVTESVLELPLDTPAGEIVNTAELYDKTNELLDEDDAVIEVLSKPELTVIKSANVETVQPGDSVVYTILVTNTGNTDLTNVVIEDKIEGGTWQLPATMPTGFSGVKVNEDGTVSVDAILGTAKQPLQLTYTCTVPDDAKDGDRITNVVVADSSETEPVDSDAIVEVKLPSIEIVKTAAAPKIAAGGDADFYITVTNIGEVELTNVNVSDSLPVIYEDEEYEADEVFAVIDKLLPEESKRFKVTYVVPEDTEDGTEIINTAKAVADNGANDEDSDTIEVFEPLDPVVPTPDFTIRKVSNVSAAKPGDTIEYSIVVANSGNVTLTNVKVTDSLPVVYGGNTYQPGEVLTTIETLEPGDSVVVDVQYVVPATEVAGTFIINKATAEPEGVDPKSSECFVQTLAADNPSYTISKVANVTTVAPGGTVSYTIVVTNTGNCPINDLTVYDDLLGKTFNVGALGIGQVWQTQPNEAVYTVPATAQDAQNITNNAEGASTTTQVEAKKSTWVLSVYDSGKGIYSPETGDNTNVWVFVVIMAVAAVVVTGLLIVMLRNKKLTR